MTVPRPQLLDALQRMALAIAPALLVFVLLLSAWEAIVRFWNFQKFFLPRPIDVLQALHERGYDLLLSTGTTAVAALSGFVLSLTIGTIVAVLFAQSKWIARAFYPYAIFLQTVPIVAIAPIIITLFGADLRSVIVVAFTISIFPIITNGYAGLTQVDPNLSDLFTLLGANRWQRLFKLQLPTAVPFLVAGAKIASGLAVWGPSSASILPALVRRATGWGILFRRR